MEDPSQLLQSGSERQAQVLTEMAGLGVDTVRSQVQWRDVAGDRPGRYPPERFDALDDLVRGAQARGMKVLLVPTSPIPRWASGCHGAAAKANGCKPDPSAFAAFVRLVGKRYSGRFHDEDQGGGVLPRVDRWGLWNEPNLATYLQPQFSPAGVDVGAAMYRDLAQRAIAALRGTGHGSDTILLGETAPVGRTTGPPATRNAPPVTFLRALFHTRGPRLGVSGFAHHPYTQGAHSTPYAPTSPGQISFTTIGRLKRLLKQGARAGVIRAHLPIWYTEFGYQSDPPDPILGVSLSAQAEYLNLADFLAARDPRIASVSQYKLVDPNDRDSFETGLRRFGTLAQKPAYAAYRLPLWVQRRGAKVRAYGQLRPAPARSRQTVVLQRSAAPGEPFTDVDTFRVRTRTEQFLHVVPYAVGVWRLKWLPPGSEDPIYSRVAVAHAKP